MPSPIPSKSKRDTEGLDTITMEDVSKEAQGLVDQVIKDVGKTSAAKQLVLGCASGWMTGYLMMKVGKVAAVALGGGIILLQVASHNGYIKVNWDRLYKKVDEVGDKLEASASGSKGPKLMDKVERFVDRKLDKMEEVFKKKERKAKKWYNQFVHDEDHFVFQEIHVFLASFIAGFAMGIVFGRI